MPQNILAIETATPVCSVALRLKDGEAQELRQIGTGIHSEMVFVFTDELMKDNHIELAELDGIILSAGPGSYTGLRVGSSAVKGMLFGSDAGLYAANTLAGIALGAKKEHPDAKKIHAVLDARRKHLYHQMFTFEGNQPLAKEDSSIKALTDFGSIIKQGELIAGTGLNRLAHEIRENSITAGEEIISAINLIDLFNICHGRNDTAPTSLIKKVAPERFEPYY
ncbi:MAG: tRNA (adenosine(37)-N6)-threonylcarbamoyltransferase complex dimerization subunit type 1 TsaB [Balneolales bacterium]